MEPSDFDLFEPVKKHVIGKWFERNADIKQAVYLLTADL
jgi:hypothetical protein